MNPLPFRRIAILEPDLVFSDPVRQRFDHKSAGELRIWLKKIEEKGADAVYVRVYDEVEAFRWPLFEVLLRDKDENTCLIFPAATYKSSQPLPADCYHLRSNETIKNALTGDNRVLRGRSCHSREEALKAQAEGMDYVFLSPVFSTKTHPDAKPLGLEKLREVCTKVDIPVFALGGINPEREKACREVGAHGIAAIRMFSNEGDIA
jgi:thiamine-phosphate pyrophosphorylase